MSTVSEDIVWGPRGTHEIKVLFFFINVWVSEVGILPIHQILLDYYPIKENLGVSTDQRKFDLCGFWTHDLRIRSTDATRPVLEQVLFDTVCKS